jgi:hypothetical protein
VRLTPSGSREKLTKREKENYKIKSTHRDVMRGQQRISGTPWEHARTRKKKLKNFMNWSQSTTLAAVM